MSLNKHGQKLGPKGKQTRQAIIEATVELLVEQSWKDLAVADIARKAGLSSPAFYLYFDDVTEVMLAACEQSEAWCADIVALLASEWPDTEALHLCQKLVVTYAEAWEKFRPIFQTRNIVSAGGDLRFLRVRHESAMPIITELTKKFAHAQARNRVPGDIPPESLAVSAVVMLERMAAVVRRDTGPEPVNYANIHKAAAYYIACALGAPR